MSRRRAPRQQLSTGRFAALLVWSFLVILMVLGAVAQAAR